MTVPIPQPPGLPLLGNLKDVDPHVPITSLLALSQRYGEVFQLSMLGRTRIFAGSQKVVHELADQKRFKKLVIGPLEEVRKLAGDGLFTAHQEEQNWAIAHRILIPAFGPLSIRGMLPGMTDIASQLVAKWERFGDAPIDVAADFTKLALDTIALCSMGHRFNSFYASDPPAFVGAMGRSLTASGARARRLPMPSAAARFVYGSEDAEFEKDVHTQWKIAEDLVAERVQNPTDGRDLLNVMLNGVDPVTGQKLSHENIRFQLVTFLIAGHETTSAIRREVDEICGGAPVSLEHLSKLKYVDASLKEALRLQPTAPAWTVTPLEDTTICDGKYAVKSGQPIGIILHALHRDPAVWGDDVEDFRPERMLDGRFEALPPDAWKPFGNGVRACIGRPFAWQEALLAVAMIFQHFDMRPHDVNYKLSLKSTLTIKPDGLFMHATPRKDRLVPASGQVGVSGAAAPAAQPSQPVGEATPSSGSLPLHILYGSNSGTCEAFAQKLASSAASHGCKADVKTLNTAASGDLPKDGPVIVITASYEGKPTDDAAHFVEWVKGAASSAADNIQFAVFGCGHTDWASTYQSIPTLIDERLAACGGKRICDRGVGNAAGADLFGDFDDWADQLWAVLAKTNKLDAPEQASAGLRVDVDSRLRVEALRHGFLGTATVLSNEVITRGDDFEVKRHIEIAMPEGTTYRAGDYIGILPVSPMPLVQRALIRFGLAPDDVLTIKSSTSTSFPVDRIAAFNVFSGFVELDQPATLRNVKLLAERAEAEERDELAKLTQPDVYAAEVSAKRVSLLALMERYPRVKVSLAEFLENVPLIRMRQYSISSSPLDDPARVSITVGILDAPHLSGKGRYLGATTNYLAHLLPGSKIRAAIRPSGENFHPPTDPAVPMIMLAAGTGMAPFRAFIQERSLQKQAGRAVGPALLFYGCHSPETDLLYDDEMKAWEAQGVVQVRHAFSREPANSQGCHYVQDRLWHDRADAAALFRAEARVYICGASRLARAVEDTAIRIFMEEMAAQANDGSRAEDHEERAREAFKACRGSRFATDVFG